MTGADIIVVGGGVIGLSVAYHLARGGADDVLLLERNELSSGTSWHAAGIIGPLRATSNMTRLAMNAAELFGELESETGQATGYTRTGGMWLAQSAERKRELQLMAGVGERTGFGVALLSAREAQERFPMLRVDDLASSLWVDEDGQANPVDVCMAYSKAARKRGVRIELNANVSAISRTGGRVTGVALADGRTLTCKTLVNCAGTWSRSAELTVGQPMPVQAVSHMYVVTEPIVDLPTPCPIVRDLDARIYIKADAGRLVLGCFEPDPKLLDIRDQAFAAPYVELPEDWEQYEPFMEAGLHRMPALETVGIQHFMNGPEGFTPDTKPLIGPVPGIDGYFVAAGFNSLGIVSSAGAGRALAEWIVDGRPGLDLWDLDVARLNAHSSTPGFLVERMREAVANQLDMHWPYKQPRTARNVCRTPLHRELREQGAVFGEFAGWERPLWFAMNADERELRYSYGAQHWWPYAAREGRTMSDSVAIFDLTPFTKIDLLGPDALAALQRLCVSNMDLEPNRTRYTQMLNEHGGIEADVTVSRLKPDHWRTVSGAATRRKDLEWIRRHVSDLRVAVCDVTSSEVVLGIMGPASRTLLQQLSGSDLSNGALPFGSAIDIDVGMVWIRAQRCSFVGELGFELYCPVEVALHVYERLLATGADLGLIHAGMLCLDGCRLEKGFPHWGHDIGTHDTPLEAGLSFCVDWQKTDHFIGGEALVAQRERGIARRRMLFDVPYTDSAPLLIHDEPIFRDGEIVGMTTSGGLGPRTQKALAMGYVECAPGAPRREVLTGEYEILIGGQRRTALALEQPPFDPNRTRMRDSQRDS